jgi:hypothetical protein
MNFYKHIFIFYHKILFLVLFKFTHVFPSKLIVNYSIDINNNNLNLIAFTIKTFDYTDLKLLLLNYNDSNVISKSHFSDSTLPSFISLFDSEGKLFAHYGFLIHKPDNEKAAELAFDNFVLALSQDIFKNCVYETMNKNVSTDNYKFYMHISYNDILDEE